VSASASTIAATAITLEIARPIAPECHSVEGRGEVVGRVKQESDRVANHVSQEVARGDSAWPSCVSVIKGLLSHPATGRSGGQQNAQWRPAPTVPFVAYPQSPRRLSSQPTVGATVEIARPAPAEPPGAADCRCMPRPAAWTGSDRRAVPRQPAHPSSGWSRGCRRATTASRSCSGADGSRSGRTPEIAVVKPVKTNVTRARAAMKPASTQIETRRRLRDEHGCHATSSPTRTGVPVPIRSTRQARRDAEQHRSSAPGSARARSRSVAAR